MLHSWRSSQCSKMAIRGLIYTLCSWASLVAAAGVRPVLPNDIANQVLRDDPPTERLSDQHAESVAKLLPNPTHAGYLDVGEADGSAIYFAFFEAQHATVTDSTPIVLWLQGGPGCASTFGGFYELGPYNVHENLRLIKNAGSWNRIHGLLLMDQPVGSGYSYAASNSSIPTDEMGMATHLYRALQGFFAKYASMQKRPLFITGESYAGKYVPSMAHYILQAAAGRAQRPSILLQQRRALPLDTAAPLFNLTGVAVGNGLTDPRTQTQTLADSAFYMGLLSPQLRQAIQDRAQLVVTFIDKEDWAEAHRVREELRGIIENVTGLGTMFDTRRTTPYDPLQAVDRYLNLSMVKAAMGAKQQISYSSCSQVVGEIMAVDTMRSVKHLLPDVLQNLHVLLYQGQFDILDGVASSTSWIDTLDWPHQQELLHSNATLWHSHKGQVTAGWHRWAGRLVHAVVYRAGHMVPHDQPRAAQTMIESWIEQVVEKGGHEWTLDEVVLC